MIPYQVVFDITRESYTAWHAALVPFGLAIAILLIAALVWRLSARAELQRRRYRFVLLAAIMTSLGIAVHIVATTWRERESFERAVRSGDYTTIQGIVTQFTPEGADGHPMESFCVSGVCFRYSSSEATAAFHRTQREGGPIRDSLQVRIAEHEGRILRLEVASP